VEGKRCPHRRARRQVKQLAGQVNELREEVRGLRGGFAGERTREMRKRMEEMARSSGWVPGVSPEKMKEEMERRFKEQKTGSQKTRHSRSRCRSSNPPEIEDCKGS
jgi:hypothetical protein